jgi:hypothetical protein
VDQVLSGTPVADEMDFVDGIELFDDSSRAATPAGNSDALDDFFAQLEDVEQLEQLGDLTRIAVGSDQR